MKNRIPDYLSATTPQVPQSSTGPAEMLEAAQKQFNQRRESVEMYIQDHPAVGIGAALCIGVLVGWIIKRR